MRYGYQIGVCLRKVCARVRILAVVGIILVGSRDHRNIAVLIRGDRKQKDKVAYSGCTVMRPSYRAAEDLDGSWPAGSERSPAVGTHPAPMVVATSVGTMANSDGLQNRIPVRQV